MVPVERKDLLTLLLHYSQIHQLWKLPQQLQEYQMFQSLVRLVSQLCLHSGNWQPGSRSTQFRRIGGWSTSFFRTTWHPVAKVLDLIFFMRRKMLDPSQARFWIRKLRQTGYNQQNIIYLLAGIETRNLPLQHWFGSHLPFLAVVRISICRSRRHTIPGFIILLQKEANT